MRRSMVIAAAAVLLLGCERAEPEFVSPIAFDTATAWIHTGRDSASLLVELARTDAQRSYGLMARPSLDPNSGMVFLYDSVQGGEQGFWMFRTRMPLDIAFIDSAGVVVRTLTMEPCPSEMYATGCDTYLPNVPYRSALEVNAGWLAQHGVGEGARVRLDSLAER